MSVNTQILFGGVTHSTITMRTFHLKLIPLVSAATRHWLVADNGRCDRESLADGWVVLHGPWGENSRESLLVERMHQCGYNVVDLQTSQDDFHLGSFGHAYFFNEDLTLLTRGLVDINLTLNDFQLEADPEAAAVIFLGRA